MDKLKFGSYKKSRLVICNLVVDKTQERRGRDSGFLIKWVH